MSLKILTSLVEPCLKPLFVAGLVIGVSACGGVEIPGLGGDSGDAAADLSPERQERYDAVLKETEGADPSNAEDAEAIAKRVEALAAFGKTDEALALVDQAIATKADDGSLWLAKGRTLWLSEQTEEAVTAFTKGKQPT